VSPIFNLNKQKQAASRGKGNAQIYAEIRWEMSLKALGDLLSRTLRILATLWKMLKKDWRPFQQSLQSSGDTLGNAQTKVET
jgi:hypothetical protein